MLPLNWRVIQSFWRHSFLFLTLDVFPKTWWKLRQQKSVCMTKKIRSGSRNFQKNSSPLCSQKEKMGECGRQNADVLMKISQLIQSRISFWIQRLRSWFVMRRASSALVVVHGVGRLFFLLLVIKSQCFKNITTVNYICVWKLQRPQIQWVKFVFCSFQLE